MKEENKMSKNKQITELKRKPVSKRANLIDYVEENQKQALDLPLIWRSLAMKTSTRDGYSITEGTESFGLCYPDFRDKVKDELIPAFYIETLNWAGDKIPYYVVAEAILIFKEMRNELLNKLKDNF